jgi:hypothetical protein
VFYWSQFLATDPEVSVSIPIPIFGATRFPEKRWLSLVRIIEEQLE